MQTEICRRTVPNCPPIAFEEVKNRLENGDLLLTRKKGLVARLTGWGMNSIWTHVGVVVRLPQIERVMVLEGALGGVRLVPLRHYVGHYCGQAGKHYPGTVCVIRSKTQLADNHSQVLANALDKLGAPYDWQEIKRIIGRWAKRGLGLKVRTHYKADHKYICSEFARDMLSDYGIKVPLNTNGTIVPGDFADSNKFNLIAVVQVLAEHPSASLA
ncbi:YiiX/YebB-like N1pC/P60 family cysteine hydrolase [Salinibius halmophilus]|uniref:YiiX/YebB-like N1pC/P60 family cysteine hydrolase n=1 Tax=Salinibius halmophilus TaxID=1853216 RepID=UPI000E6692E4|nr:YiiX/YebB-like N1pC/P60 family cysteine hydrolase [Salinibius halmophilus]